MITDTRFPQLHEASDGAVVGRALESQLFGDAVKVESCRIDELRHKPGRYCILSYRLGLRDPGAGTIRTQRLSARLLPAGDAAGNTADTAGATAVLSRPAMQVWLFPADRRLSALGGFFDDAWLAAELPVVLRGLGFSPCDRLDDIAVDTAHYIPERSCMLRCTATWTAAAATSPTAVTLYAKHYADDCGARTFDLMSQLQPQWSGGAHALHYDAQHRVLWQSELPGRTLTWPLLMAGGWEHAVAGVAACVKSLHGCSICYDRTFGFAEIRRLLEDTASLAAQLDATVAERTRSLVGRLLTLEPSPPPRASSNAPLHRDLKLMNFLLDGEGTAARVGLIDMDCVELGDPAIDLASLAGNLYLCGLRDGAPLPAIEPVVRRLLSAYGRLPVRNLRWHLAAVMLYEVVRRSIRQRNAGRLQHVDACLQISESCCSRVGC